MANAQTTRTAATETAAENLGRRAIEAARFADGIAKAGNRFTKIAMFVGNALEGAKPGDRVQVPYRAINEACGMRRGANSDNPAAVWRTGIEQARQYGGDLLARAGAIEYEKAGMFVTVL